MSYSQVAADLGISRGAIKSWVFQARKEAGKVSTSSPDRPETPEEELARLRVENDSLRADKRSLRSDVERLEEERAILRKATKYFRSEEHTSELQSRFDLVCRLLLEKKKAEACG